MQTFIGTKIINATPMTRQKYNDFRGWQLPADENGGDEGYLVEYPDGGQANTAEYVGYVSWSPRDVFDRTYRPLEHATMTFGQALDALKGGHLVAREGWNGKGMFLYLVEGSQFVVNRAPLNRKFPKNTEITYHAHIDMKTADDQCVPWLASQTDMLAEDWTIVE